MGPAAAFATATAFERDTYVRAALAAEHPLGLLIADPAVPRAHVLNMLWVTATRVAPEELAGALDAAQGHLAHRKAQVVDDALGAALAAPLRERGFAVERHVVMTLGRPRDRAPMPGLAREVDAGTHAAVEAATTRAEPQTMDPEVAGQLGRARAAIRTATPTRCFVAADEGVDAAHATLLTRDGVAQVEDVATLRRHRGRGLARAVCSAALDAAAGAGLVFMVADADDWPRELYAKLGLDVVGAVWAFTRDPT